jgi:hypothetical protein
MTGVASSARDVLGLSGSTVKRNTGVLLDG